MCSVPRNQTIELHEMFQAEIRLWGRDSFEQQLPFSVSIGSVEVQVFMVEQNYSDIPTVVSVDDSIFAACVTAQKQVGKPEVRSKF